MLELKEARMLFDAGALKDARVMPEPISGGWILLLAKKDGKKWINDNFTSRRSESYKSFKDINTAINTCKKIGFNDVSVLSIQSVD
jgi:hypothetical protein